MKNTLFLLIAALVVLPFGAFSQIGWKALGVGGSGCRYAMKHTIQVNLKVDKKVVMDEKPKSNTSEFEFRVVDELGKEKIGEVTFKKVNINGLDANNNRILAEVMEDPTLLKIDGNFFNAKMFEKEFEEGTLGWPIHAAMVSPLQAVFSIGLPTSNFKDSQTWRLTQRDTNYIKGEMAVDVIEYAFNVSGFKDTLSHACAIVNFDATSDILPVTPEILAMTEQLGMVNNYNSIIKGRALIDNSTGHLIAIRIKKGYTLNAHMKDEEMDLATQEEVEVSIIENNLPGYTKNVREKLLNYYQFNSTKKTGLSLTEKIKQNSHVDLLAAIEWDGIDANEDNDFFWLKGIKGSGAISIKGDTLVPFKNYILSSWSDPDYFENGYGVVKTAMAGYEILKRDGTTIPIDKKYHTVRAFNEGRAVVEIDDKFGDLYGLIDSTGKEVAAPFFSSIDEFNGGYARVTKDYKPGVIDINGKVVVPFNSHILVSSLYHKSSFLQDKNRSPYGISVFNKDTKEYFILTPFTNGEIKGPFQMVSHFENGLSQVRGNGGYGIIDSTCSFVIPPIYGFIWDKKNGTYLVQKNNGLYGILSSAGETISPIEYAKIEDVKGAPIYLVEKGGMKGAISNSGQVVLPTEYDYIYYLKGGMLRVMKQGVSGVFNMRGEAVLPLEFESIMCFDSSTNLFSATKQGKTSLIGLNGKVLRELHDDEHYFFCGMQDSVTVWRNTEEKYGLRHFNGSDILPFEYDDIRRFSQHGFIVHKGEEIGLVNNKGGFLLPLQKMEIEEFKWSEIITIYKIHGRYGILNTQGEVLLEPDFDAIGIVKDDLLYVKSNDKFGILKIKH